MSEAQQPGSESARQNEAHIDWFCDWIRRGVEHTADMMTPPESAGKHFREARIEFWRGIRELIGHRIDRLSRDEHARGTRVVVE